MELPVFPLPRLTFFPHTLLPLHVFEDRYRAMTAYCLEHDHLMAVGTVAGVMGAGRIVRHVKLPDGRYHMVLMGESRVRLHTELPLREGYRVFEADLLADQGVDTGQVASIRALAASLSLKSEQAADFLSEVLDSNDPAMITDRLSALLHPDQRQELLEMNRVDARLDHLVGVLAGML